jgi:hypothetical protein
MTIPSRPLRIAATASCLLLLCACQNVPKYKKSSGKFNEWAGYQGNRFGPSIGTVTAVDAAANTITVSEHGKNMPLIVLPTTRIMHNQTDIALAQVPLHAEIKFRLSEDGKQLRSIWYGEHSDAVHRNAQPKDKNSVY